MTQVKEGRLGRRLSRLSDQGFKRVVYWTALGLYLFAVWLHLPYGGGNVYSDITYVFQQRVCLLPPDEYGPLYAACNFSIPLLRSFSEYPAIVSIFMYVMGVLGNVIPGDLLRNYYLLSSAVLSIPFFLTIRELMKLLEMRGSSRNRVLWYFVITPTFIIVGLVNWYIIGVYFTLRGLRGYLEGGSRFWSGVLFGLSAASNFVTAIPALGLLFAARTMRERVVLAGAAGGTYALINAPFLITSSGLWMQSWQYIYGWNIEESWMGAVLLNPYSPLRHLIPSVVFAGFLLGLGWMSYRRTTSDPLVFAFVAMFGYVFATYIYAPQMNLALLPFFVLLPVSSGYWEFLAFDTANALIIIFGVSEVLMPFKIEYYNFFHPDNMLLSIVFWIGVVRSLWEGKFVLWNRIPGSLSLSQLRRKPPWPMSTEEEAASGG
jgi:hypothetical protein